jgi:hypothetical protein
MAYKLTTDIAAGDTTAQIKAKLTTIIDAWYGAGAAAGESTWGDWRTLLNDLAVVAGMATFANAEPWTTFAPKINALNDAEQVIAGMGGIAWWNADRSDLFSLSGSAVTAWADSFHGYSMAQGFSSARPSYSAIGFNGVPGVTFDGGDDELTCTDAALLAALPSGDDPCNLFAVAQNDAAAANTDVRDVLSYGTASLTSRQLRRISSGGVNRGAVVVGNGTTAVAIDGVTVDLSSRHVMHGDVGATSAGIAVDGNAATTGSVTPATVASRVRIGSRAASSAGFFWQGKVRDALILPDLTADQKMFVTNFLLTRRAL